MTIHTIILSYHKIVCTRHADGMLHLALGLFHLVVPVADGLGPVGDGEAGHRQLHLVRGDAHFGHVAVMVGVLQVVKPHHVMLFQTIHVVQYIVGQWHIYFAKWSKSCEKSGGKLNKSGKASQSKRTLSSKMRPMVESRSFRRRLRFCG